MSIKQEDIDAIKFANGPISLLKSRIKNFKSLISDIDTSIKMLKEDEEFNKKFRIG